MQPPQSGGLVGGTETILLVEDNNDVRAAAVTMLGELGYTVIEAANADRAMLILEAGQDFDLLDRNGQPQGWYVFAGADGEALVWDADANGFRPSLGDMSLTDQVTVGDLQAGVSVQRGGGELSLSYIRREVKYSDRNVSISETEDFAGVSFTMRR